MPSVAQTIRDELAVQITAMALPGIQGVYIRQNSRTMPNVMFPHITISVSQDSAEPLTTDDDQLCTYSVEIMICQNPEKIRDESQLLEWRQAIRKGFAGLLAGVPEVQQMEQKSQSVLMDSGAGVNNSPMAFSVETIEQYI